MRDEARGSRRAEAACLLLVLAAALIAYGPTFHNKLVSWDDPLFLFPAGGHRSAIDILTRPVPGRAFYPLFHLSLRLDLAAFGPYLSGHHGVNIGLHALNALWVFLLLRRMLAEAMVEQEARLAALAGALLFAVHPLSAEPVAWISGRKILLAAFFGLGASYAYVRGLAGGPKCRAWRAASPVLFLCACLSNAAFLALPLGLLAWALLLRQRTSVCLRDAWVRALRMTDLFLVSVVAGVVRLPVMLAPQRLLLQKSKDIAHVTLPMVFRGTVQEINSIFAPVELVHLYRRSETSWGHPAVLMCFVLLLLSGALVWAALRSPSPAKRRFAAAGFCLAWFWLISAPKLGHQIPRADRHLYVAGVGLYALLGVGLARFGARRKGAARFVLACFVVVIGLLTSQAWRQGGVWFNSVTLWGHAARVYPDWSLARGELGRALSEAGRRHEARQEFLAAVTLDPNNAESWYNLGLLMGANGRPDAALHAFSEAVRADPTFTVAHNNRGSALLKLGRLDEALASFRKALELDPTLALPHGNIAEILIKQGDKPGALSHALAGVRCDPSNAAFRANVVRFLRKGGLDAAARDILDDGIRLAERSGDADALRLLRPLAAPAR